MMTKPFRHMAPQEKQRRFGKSCFTGIPFCELLSNTVHIKYSQPGELTDKGRQTTFELGQRLRHLYVEQLGFMPKIKSDAEDMYLRASPIPRALESMQQAFMGMYPANARTADFATPAIVTRALAEETVYPNDANCRRFRQLSRLFADRAAKRCQYSPPQSFVPPHFISY
jgi:acid phosphatase